MQISQVSNKAFTYKLYYKKSNSHIITVRGTLVRGKGICNLRKSDTALETNYKYLNIF